MRTPYRDFHQHYWEYYTSGINVQTLHRLWETLRLASEIIMKVLNLLTTDYLDPFHCTDRLHRIYNPHPLNFFFENSYGYKKSNSEWNIVQRTIQTNNTLTKFSTKQYWLQTVHYAQKYYIIVRHFVSSWHVLHS